MRRRSQRLILDVPVIIQGQMDDSGVFQEETFTVLVSAHGALIMLAARVAVGQSLVVMNPQNWDEREVRVASVGAPYAGLAQVGVEFKRPSPEFWPVSAPPEDWKALQDVRS